MKPGFAAVVFCLLISSALAADDRAVVDVGRDWRLSDLRKAVKVSGKNLPNIITGVSIVDDDTLTVYLVSTRQPLSGSGAEATLKYSKEEGWKVTRVTYFDR